MFARIKTLKHTIADFYQLGIRGKLHSGSVQCVHQQHKSSNVPQCEVNFILLQKNLYGPHWSAQEHHFVLVPVDSNEIPRSHASLQYFSMQSCEGNH